MKVVKIILGLAGAGILLAGGFMAGSFITQTRAAASAPVVQPIQPRFTWQQPNQPTVIPQEQKQSTIVPQSTSPAIPPQTQWRLGMRTTNHQGEWEHGWMMDPNYAPQGKQSWGMHDGMMGGYNWQTNPNGNSVPNATPIPQSYPIPSTSISFKDTVQPIFVERCVACHGGTNGLYLDTYENILNGSVNGAVVLPGDVYNSRLAYYVYSGYMPFRNTPLTATEIQSILDWIAAGALNN